MKTISVLVPTYNEEPNVAPLHDELVRCFETDLPEYDYEIVFIDNDLTQVKAHPELQSRGSIIPFATGRDGLLNGHSTS